MSEQRTAILHGTDSPHNVAPCAFVRLVPVRFALSSEDSPPVQSRLPLYMKAVPEKPNLKYTLRLLRDGYLHIFHKPDKQKHSWRVENGKVKQTSLLPSGGRRGDLTYIFLPADWESVYLAFSDAPGEDFWPSYQKDEERLISRMHELRWEKGKGLSSRDTLCGSADDLLEWVEEFRAAPGYVRAPFEYADNTVLEYFDPDLEHFKPTRCPEAIARRWRGTAGWEDMKKLPQRFSWLRTQQGMDDSSQSFPPQLSSVLQPKGGAPEQKASDPDAGVICRELKSCTPSGLIALSDPAGICLECAALHQAALNVRNDFSTWNSHAHTLCLYLEAWDSMPRPFARQDIVYSPNRLWAMDYALSNPSPCPSGAYIPSCSSLAMLFSGTRISDAFLPWFQKGLRCLDPHLNELIPFWLAWLNEDGRFSFSQTAGDYDTSTLRGSNGWEELFSLCTYKITAHECGLHRVREDFAKQWEQGRLARMFRDRLKNSLWAANKDYFDEAHTGFTLLLINFSSLLPSRLDIVEGMTMEKVPAYVKDEIMPALYTALIKKLGAAPEDSPETDHLALLKLLVAAQGFTCLPEAGYVGDKVPLGIFLRSSVSVDRLGELKGRERDFDIAANLLKAGELTVQSLQRIVKASSPLFRQAARVFARFVFSSRQENERLSPGCRGIFELAGLCIAAATLLQSLYEQTTDEKRGKSGWVDVIGSAFGVIELYQKSGLTLLSKPYNLLATPLRGLLERGPAWARTAAGYAKLPFTPVWAGRLAGVGAIFWSAQTALEDMAKGEERTAAGNWLLAAGAGLMMIKGAALCGLIFSIAGLVLVMFGKTSRLQYRIANCYFGEDNDELPMLLAQYDKEKKLNRAPTDIVRKLNETAGGFNPESNQGIVPFSLKRGFVPTSLDNKKKAPEFYEKRTAQLTLDLKALEMSLLCVSLSVLHDTSNGLIHVHLTVPFAAPSATMRVKSLRFVLQSSPLSAKEIPVYDVLDLKSIRMSCTLKNGRPCWFFAFPAPKKVAESYGINYSFIYSYAPVTSLYRYSLCAKVTVDFEYASNASDMSDTITQDAINLLKIEDAAYRKKDDEFKVRDEEQFRALLDHELTAEVMPLASL